MDIEHWSHKGHTVSVIIAVVLSGLLVTVAALVGRGAINIKGALLEADPTDVTVIAAVEPKLDSGVTIQGIEFLRKEDVSAVISTKPYYAYLVKTSDNVQHLVRLAWDTETKAWTLLTYEKLHE